MGFLNKLIGIPPVASKHGEMVDHMLELVHWFMLLLFVGWTLYLAYAYVRYYRKNNTRASYAGVTGNATNHIEIGVIIAEIILLVGFAFPLWAKQVDQFPDPDVRIHAYGQQFSWNFHYTGPDGKFGIANRFLITPDNPVGIDPEDINGMDDFITSDLVIPKDKKIEIAVTSKDVIHNLALVGMRTATDAMPGSFNRLWFVPIVAGKSEIICGQLCGAAHGNMKALLDVVPTQAAFESWSKEQQPVREKGFAADAAKRFGVLAPATAPASPAAIPVPSSIPTPVPAAVPAPTSPAVAPAADAVKISLGVIPNTMKFDVSVLSVPAGSKVQMLFRNEKCALQHNFLLLKQGTKDAVGLLADKMLTDPNGMAKQYIPETDAVIAKGNKLIGIGQSDLIEFTAPTEPGDYPYICTFPGHWRLMNGIMQVK